MGLQAPSELERQKQQEDINLSRVQQDTGRIQQNVFQQKLDEEKRAEEFKQKAADNYWATLQDVNATPEQIASSKQGLFYAFPEIAKQNEAMQKSATELQKGFASSMAKRLLVAFDSKNQDVIDQTFKDLTTAARSKPELAVNLQGLETMKKMHETSPESAYGMARSVVSDADPKFLSEYFDSRKKQQEVEGGGASELDPKQFADAQDKFQKQIKPRLEEWNTIASFRNTAIQAAPNVAGDMALARAYIKSLTPGESVMGDDMAQIAGNNAAFGNLLDRMGAKITGDGTLPPKARLEIKAEIEKIVKSKEKDFKKYISEMEPTLKRAKLKKEDVFAGIVPLAEPEKGKDGTPAGALIPYDPKNKDAKRTMERVKKQEDLAMPQDQTSVLGEPLLIPPMPVGAVRLKK